MIQALTVHRIDCDARQCLAHLVSFDGPVDVTLAAHDDGWAVLTHLTPAMHFCPRHRDAAPA